MTKKTTTGLSRRQVLAGLGTIGVASAGAGLGTTAFYSDRESLEGWFEAGRVDLKLDYRTTYMPWLESDEVSERVAELFSDPSKQVYVVDGTQDTGGMEIYQTDSCPRVGEGVFDVLRDENDEPITDENGVPVVDSHIEWGNKARGIQACDGQPTDSEGNDVTLVDGQGNDDPENVEMFVDLADIKPGDEGETTFSLHLCGNPAYMYMRAMDVESLENVRIEPEAEAGDTTTGEMEGELAEYMYVEFFRDPNCSNIAETVEDGVCVSLVIDNSSSSNTDFDDGKTRLDCYKETAEAIVDLLDAGDGTLGNSSISLTIYGSNDQQVSGSSFKRNARIGDSQDLTAEVLVSIADGNDKSALQSAISAIPDGTGGSPLYYGLELAGADIATELLQPDSVCADKPLFSVVFTDGKTNDLPADASAGVDGTGAALVDSSTIDISDVPGTFATEDEGALAKNLATVSALREPLGPTVPPVETTIMTVAVDIESQDFRDNLFALASANILGPNGRLFYEIDDADECAIVAALVADVIDDLATDDVLFRGPLSAFLDAIEEYQALPDEEVEACTWPRPKRAADCAQPGVYCYGLRWALGCKEEDFAAQEICDRLAPEVHPVDAVDEVRTMADWLVANELPLNANVTQTDSAHFTLEFMTEQCRHNPVEETSSVPN